MLLAFPLIGVAVTVAVLRHQLLDIRLVVSRTVLYLVLTGLVLVAYVVLVAAFDSVLRRQVGLGTSVAATVLIAIGFNPVRLRLQRLVDRALYGDRADPVRAAAQVGARMGEADTGLGGVLDALRSALRLPFAAVRGTQGEIGAAGTAPQTLHAIPLTYGGERVGELVVGARSGEHRLAPADRAVLELVAAPLAAAVFATALSQELQRSRERIVSAREEERRRLRRDLHDGLGPALTGVTLQADLARNLVPVDPARAVELLTELRRQTSAVIDEIRRVAYGLRPPALDELGLLAALRQQIAQLSLRSDGAPVAVHLDLPDAIPVLPAAVESAAYRIAIEALSNALRHARAGHIHVQLRLDRELSIEVRDDGAPNGNGAGWSAGVGLRSMQERAAELGGSCVAGPSGSGGLVTARLPLWSDELVPAGEHG
jgi:signal transduction histidine kinase